MSIIEYILTSKGIYTWSFFYKGIDNSLLKSSMMSSCVLVLAKLCLALFLVVFSSFLGEGKVLEDGCENIVDADEVA